MAWNEPGGGKNNQDPWRGNNDKGPPDLDEFFRQLQKKLNGLFGGGSGSNGKNQGDSSKNVIVFILIFLLAGFWAVKGIYRVEEAEQAVVLKFGKYHTIVGAGLHWHPPILFQIYIENTQKIRRHTHRASMLTQDENIVAVEIEVQYRIADLAKFFLKINDPEGSLRQATESALRHVVGTSSMHRVLTEGREEIAIEVMQRTQEYLEIYSSGLLVSKVNVEDAQPPEDVKEAFDDVIKAKEDRLRFKNEAETYANGVIPESEGRAQRTLEQASAYKEEVVARAGGETARFSKLLGEYQRAPEVTRKRLYLETMESIMSNSSKVLLSGGDQSNQLVYLPLDQLIQNKNSSKSISIDRDAPKAPSASTLLDSSKANNRNGSVRGRDANYRGREGR